MVSSNHEPGVPGSHLLLAIRQGNLESVERILKLDVAANAAASPDAEGTTPLLAAASLGRLDIVKALLRAGAARTVDAAGTRGMTALMLAAAGGYTAVVNELLTSGGADLKAADANGWTALHHAAFKGNTSTCESLVCTHGADPNVCTKKGETPLTLAALTEKVDACKTLLSCGAEVALLRDETDKAFVLPLVADLAEPPSMQGRRCASIRSLSLATNALEEQMKEDEGADLGCSSPSVVASPNSTLPRAPSVQRARSPSLKARNVHRAASPSRRHSTSPRWAGEAGMPEGAVALPVGARRASPVYVPATSAPADVTSAPHPSTAGAVQAQRAAQAGGDWPLQAFAYRGTREGFLLDAITHFVYWTDAVLAQSSPLPLLVGKLTGHTSGNPATGTIVPLTVADCATAEVSAPALRCLRRQSSAAALLWAAARKTDAVRADCAPETGSAPYFPATSLAVPLCAILGVSEVHELSTVTARDLAAAEVDAAFLPELHRLGALPLGGDHNRSAALHPTSPSGRNSRTGSPRIPMAGWGPSSGPPSPTVTSTKRNLKALATTLPVLPTLPQLLAKHGLSKLLPVVSEHKLLSMSELHRWSELSTLAASVRLSVIEVLRLKALLKSIAAAQEQSVSLQASRMLLLSKLTLGSLVVYEADPVRAAVRGPRLAGIILEDLGPEALGNGCTGKQYRVRDLLDDSLVWQSPGQLRRLTPLEAPQFLRADLLPPSTTGTPVTPLTAAPGLWVQLTPWAQTSILDDYDLAFVGGRSPGVDHSKACVMPGAPTADEATVKAMQQVVGVLLEPVTSDGLVWTVMWPDQVIRRHNVGANGAFDLAHMQLHRLAGAPFTRGQFPALLAGSDMRALPVVRAPYWAQQNTDDEVPGAPGLAFLDAAQAAVSVLWSRRQSGAGHVYCQDAQGNYPLCHALLGGSPMSCMAAKPGVLVEPAEAASPQLVAAAAHGPGTLVNPVALDLTVPCVRWRVKWPSGLLTLHDIGISAKDAELAVSETHTLGGSDRVVLLNEVSKRGTNSSAVIQALAGVTRAGFCGCGVPGCGGACMRPALGRPLFARDPARKHHWGMLGTLVKLNLGALGLQPGCDQGPLAAYEPRPLAEQLAMKKEGTLGRAPRDDVGLVVKDAGPGAWRSLMVRKLGSTQSFWYDEAVLLPVTQEDIRKQVQRQGPAYVPPRHLHGVPVTDATAAPGMLVQRAYVMGAAQDGRTKAQMVGELVARVGEHTWQVRWPDCSVSTFKTGAANKFQLCFVNLHDTAGAPLMASTVEALTAAAAGPIPVTDGPHASANVAPGTVRFVNDPETQQSLMLHELAQHAACGMVATSMGERCLAGGPLKIYELSHVVRPGDVVTIYTAKRGLRVMLASEEAPADEDGTGGPLEAQPPPRIGVLRAPTRLAVRAVMDVGNSVGSGAPGGPPAVREPILLQDASQVYWEVEWSNGRIEEALVGTTAAQTPLRVASQVVEATESQEEDGAGEAEAQTEPDAGNPAALYLELCRRQHFVRMLEPVLLLPCADINQATELELVARPLQLAISWTNQVMRELCGVWWAAACLHASAMQVAEADNAGGPCLLWRPHLVQLAAQPDWLAPVIKKREAGSTRWRQVDVDREGELAGRVAEEVDLALASALQALTGLQISGRLLHTPSSTTTSSVHHFCLDMTGRLLDVGTVVSGAGLPQEASEVAQAALQAVDDALRDFRLALRVQDDAQESGVPAWDVDIMLEPSLNSAPPPGGAAMLSLVRQVAPALDQPEDPEAAQVLPVGPLALLATNCAAALQSALLQAHRVLGALTMSTPLPGPTEAQSPAVAVTPRSAPLTLAGRSAHDKWLGMPENLFPRDVGAARCLALANAQLFTLRRVCACLNTCPGGGTANVAHQLLVVLKVLRAKAQASLNVKGSQSLMAVASAAHEAAVEAIDKHENNASEIKPFNHADQHELVMDVCAALQRLKLATAYALKACEYADLSMPPASTPAVEPGEVEAAQGVQQASRELLEEVIDAVNRLYPPAVDAIKHGLLSITAVMRGTLLEANEKFRVLKTRQQSLVDARKQLDVAERAMRGAEDDCAIAEQALERKVADLDKARKNVEVSERALKDATAELGAAKSPDNGVGNDTRGAPGARLNAAEANVTEINDRLVKLRAFLDQTTAEHARAEATVQEAAAVVAHRRGEVERARSVAAAEEADVQHLSIEARTLDPGSVPPLEESKLTAANIASRADKQAKIAGAVVGQARASLAALHRLQSQLPETLRAPEAMLRYTGRAVSLVALLGATSAAEATRTAVLQLEQLLLDFEEQEKIAMTVAALEPVGAGRQSVSSAASVAATRATAATGSGANPALANKITLPAVDDVTRLVNGIHDYILPAAQACGSLLARVPNETQLAEDGAPGVLNRGVLTATLDRVLQTTATALDRLGAVAAAHVSWHVAEAAAALGGGKDGGGSGVKTPAAAAAAPPSQATESLAAALRASRIASLVAEAARGFPTTPADLPTSEPKVAMAVLATLRTAQGHATGAQKEVTKLSHEMTVKLSKSGLGAAATPAAVLAAAYSELGRNSSSVLESSWWCREAASLFAKAKAAADATIAAAAPAHHTSAAQGDDGDGDGGEEESPEKKRDRDAETAAKLAAAAETERVVSGFVADLAVKLCQAAVDWALKVMSPLSDSSSIDDLPKEVALAVAAARPSILSIAPASARPDRSRSSTPAPGAAAPVAAKPAEVQAQGAAPHPDEVVAQIRELVAPLQMVDAMFRASGNHSQLDAIDSSVKDVLSTVAEAARMHAEMCQKTVRHLQDELEESLSDLDADRLTDTSRQAGGLAHCVLDTVAAAQTVFALVPLVLPEDKAFRQLKEARAGSEELLSLAHATVRTAESALQDCVVVMPSSASPAVSDEELLAAALRPHHTQLAVELGSPSAAAEPASPTRRGAANRGPPPPLKLSITVLPPTGRHAPLCEEVTEEVLGQVSVRTLLAPYHSLLHATNEAVTAIHAAAREAPTDAEVAALTHSTTATGGSAAAPASQNALQLQRWGTAVANARATVELVHCGFAEAAASVQQLPPLDVLWLPPPA